MVLNQNSHWKCVYFRCNICDICKWPGHKRLEVGLRRHVQDSKEQNKPAFTWSILTHVRRRVESRDLQQPRRSQNHFRVSKFKLSQTTLRCNLWKGAKIFQTIPSWTRLSQTGQRKTTEKSCNFYQNISMKIFFTTHLYFLVKKFTFLGVFAKTFLLAIKPSKCPTKEDKGE